MTPWTKAEVEKAHSMFAKGLEYRAIAVLLGRSSGSVRYRVSNFGIPPEVGTVFYTQEEDDLLLKLRAEGTPYRRIQAVMSNRTVRSLEVRYHRLTSGGQISTNVHRLKKEWTGRETARLRALVARGLAIGEIQRRLGRSYMSVTRQTEKIKADPNFGRRSP
jgi:DNA-binding NarL/FixJ family response regulator